jgi:molybdenum cofactor guanylyltransferase
LRDGGLPAQVRVPDAAGFVLAGGRSTRMGQDKALIKLGPRPLILWGLEMLREAGVETSIAGSRNAELAAYGRLIPDEWEDAGPLGGVCSALRQMERDWAVFVTVDQPLMAPEVVLHLLGRARESNEAVTVASVNGVAQTFPAVVRRDALPVLEMELNEGRRGCLAAFRAVGLQTIPVDEGIGPDARSKAERWFWNVNTPEDLEELRRIVLHHDG